MAFTNVYDDTFPPDTQLANLLGQDLRNFRLDVQQRMAAISGLDAAKPAFGSDAQPANWNGILFFATDTGKVYQFNNPSWTDVTASFLVSGMFNVLNSNGIAFAAGSTNYFAMTGTFLSATESSVQNIVSRSGTFKALYIRTLLAQPSTGSLVITLRINGVSQPIVVTIPASGGAAVWFDVAHTASFAVGGLVNYQVTNNASTTSAGIQSISLGY